MVVNTNGKRKTAKARATIKEGDGEVRINSRPLKTWPEMSRLRIKEPLKIAGELSDEVDIEVNVNGGGKKGQTDAIRVAIARGLADYAENGEELRQKFRDYDRYLLVEDFRRTETRKPSQSSKGARHKQQKSYR
ncbi:MAG: 30S ribosomal protein S9 [Candidatus Nanohaloarchaeota archaeon QJJ-9]|nr:30S ribosomal protein S9 [Candidatus Nanohaloarchaeota archaeon QJJ-9]